MTPLRRRGFALHSTKTPWTKPEVRRFETPEQLLASYCKQLPQVEFQKLIRVAEQLQLSAREIASKTQSRKSAAR